jgi:tol-pal system protein YbgF
MTQLSTSVTGSVDKLTAALDSFQKSMADSRANSGSRLDTMSTQVQGLSDNLDEIRGRLGKIDQQLVDLQNSVRDMDSKLTTSIAAPPAGAPATPSVASTSTTPLPSADVLYSNGYRDLIAGNYDLAQQEFQTYVKDYPGTELASNAQFYLGEIAFVQKKFDDAVAAYDTVLQKYPNSFKRPSARFKKGLALIALGRKQAGISELRGVIHDYPGTDEAKLATARLHQIGVPVKTPSH